MIKLHQYLISRISILAFVLNFAGFYFISLLLILQYSQHSYMFKKKHDIKIYHCPKATELSIKNNDTFNIFFTMQQ